MGHHGNSIHYMYCQFTLCWSLYRITGFRNEYDGLFLQFDVADSIDCLSLQGGYLCRPLCLSRIHPVDFPRPVGSALILTYGKALFFLTGCPQGIARPCTARRRSLCRYAPFAE